MKIIEEMLTFIAGAAGQKIIKTNSLKKMKSENV
jgi:hypothetical protein